MPQTSSAATAPTPTLQVPLLPSVTPDGWAAVMKGRPPGVSQSDWRDMALVIAEIGSDRAVPASRIKKAIATLKSAKSDSSAGNLKKLDAAYESALLSEATPSGRKQLAEQAHVAFGKAKQVVKPGPAPAPASAVAARAAGATKPTGVAKPTRPGIAQPTRPGIAQPTRPAASGDDAAYAKIADAVKANKGKTYTYGKLNFAYEIARKKGDGATAGLIARDMREMRPLAPGPGRFGVSDKEYKNYAMVVTNITAGNDSPAAAMKIAADTAKKFGHTEVALSIQEKLPSAPAKAKAPVMAAKAPAAKAHPGKTVAKAAPVAAAATVTLHKPGQAVTGPEFYRGVPKSVWAKLPPPPSQEISVTDWQTYAMVHYHLGTKHEVPGLEDLWTASTVATKVGRKDRAKIYRGLMSDSPLATKFDGYEAARTTKPVSKYAASKIVESIIVDASKSQDPKVLKLAADIAKQQGHTKTYAALMAKIPKAPGAAAAPAVAVAAKELPRGKIVAGRTGKPAGTTDEEWTKFTKILHAVNAKKPVPLADIDWAKALADRINYGNTSIQLARTAADIRHRQAVAAKQPAKGEVVTATAPAPAEGRRPTAATVAKVAVPLVATVATVAAPKKQAPTAAPAAPVPMLPSVSTPAMLPADTVAEVAVTPPKKVIETAAKATGVPPGAVAEKLMDAKNDTGDARVEIARGADLNRRLASKDEQTVSVAREELRDLQAKKAAGDPEATSQLVALGAAAASATAAFVAMTAAAKASQAQAQVPSEAPKPTVATKEQPYKVEAPQASIVGKPEGSGVGAAVVAGLGFLGLGVIAYNRRKKRG